MAEKGDESSEEEATISEDVVVTKYQMAAEIANRVIKAVASACLDGAVVLDLCEIGDKMILEETQKVFKKEKEMKKGIAFPTCVSVNNCICNFSPLRSDPPVKLKTEDVVKIDLGVHIDGYCAIVGSTIVVGCTKDNPVTGKKADVIQAAYIASEIAHRMLKPGGENFLLSDTIQKAAVQFKCTSVEGIVSYCMKRNRFDEEKTIMLNPSDILRKELKKCEFELYEAYCMDVIVSTGEGKPKHQDARTTVFKRTDEVYNLKMKASRAFYSEVTSKFDVMPFTLRAFDEEGKARMGVVECVTHKLLDPFDVLYDKEGEFVAQFKFTVLLMPNGPLRITSGPFDPDTVKSSVQLEDPELKALLSSSTKKAKKKKKAKASETPKENGAAEDTKK
ncbi:proliferation-associated protein 2G4-like [Dysidea avara]|uniref:proliferation-associated protein 2G4-like n=1 Tax=Dysidea avara TaxID=196820 RepID=UPI003318D0A8